MSNYIQMFSGNNPIKGFMKYILHKSMKKFLKTEINITDEDLSMKDITFNDLDFNCEVRSILFLIQFVYFRYLIRC